MELLLLLVIIAAVFVALALRKPRAPARFSDTTRIQARIAEAAAPAAAPRKSHRRSTRPIDPLRLPALTSTTTATVASESQPGANWIVDLDQRTCNCPDFLKRRQHLAVDDARRLCKHGIKVLFDRGLTGQLSPLQRAVLNDRFFPSFDFIHCQRLGDIEVAFAWRDGERWINLFAPAARGSANYARFGYNLHERRWAGGDAPRWVRGASAAIKELLA